MRPSRLFRTIFRFVLLILTMSMSLVSFLGGYSAILILSDEENVVVPDGDIFYNLDIYDPGNMSVEFPFKIKNAGFFDLEDLEMSMILYLNFADKDEPNNGSSQAILLDIEKSFSDIRRGRTYEGNFSLEAGDFKTLNYTDIGFRTDKFADPPIWFTADIKLSASYSLGLLRFSVEMYDVDIGEQMLTP